MQISILQSVGTGAAKFKMCYALWGKIQAHVGAVIRGKPVPLSTAIYHAPSALELFRPKMFPGPEYYVFCTATMRQYSRSVVL